MRLNAHDHSLLHPLDMVHQALALFSRRGSSSASARVELFYASIAPQAPFVLRVAQALLGGAKRYAAEAHQLARDTMLEAHRTLAGLNTGNFKDEKGAPDARAFLAATMRRLRAQRPRTGAKRSGDAALNLDVLREELQNMSVDGATNGAVTFNDPWDDVEDPVALLGQFSDSSLIDALHRLPEEIRWALILVDIEGISPASAAAVMSVPPNTLTARLRRGRAGLRASLYPTYE